MHLDWLCNLNTIFPLLIQAKKCMNQLLQPTARKQLDKHRMLRKIGGIYSVQECKWGNWTASSLLPSQTLRTKKFKQRQTGLKSHFCCFRLTLMRREWLMLTFKFLSEVSLLSSLLTCSQCRSATFRFQTRFPSICCISFLSHKWAFSSK